MYIGFIIGGVLFVGAIFAVIMLVRSSKKNQMLIDIDNALKAKDYQNAYSLANKVLSIDNFNPWAKYYAGDACLHLGHGVKAINYFKTALYNIQSQDDDLREVLHRKIADYYYKSQSWEEAITYYHLMHKDKPDHPHALLRLAHIHYELKEYNKAIKFIADYLKAGKENIDSLFLKARIYYKLQKYEESKKNFQVLLSQPNTADSVKMESYLRIIDIYIKDKNGDQALHYCEHANELGHRETMKSFKPELIKRWIASYLLLNQPDDALNTLDKYQTTLTSSQFADQLYLIGNKSLRMGNEYKALKTLHILFQQDPHYKNISDFVQNNEKILNYPELEKLFGNGKSVYTSFMRERLDLSAEASFDDDEMKTIFYETNNSVIVVFHTLNPMQPLAVKDIQAAVDKKLMGATPIEAKIYHYHTPQMDAKDMNLSQKTKIFSGDDFIQAFSESN